MINSTLEELREIIKTMNDEFGAHEFIAGFIRRNEALYASELKGVNGDFQRLHAQLGRLLSENKERLGIEKIGKRLSRNIKGYDSECEFWKKSNQ